MAEQYEAVTEDEWKTLATTEITHLTDEEKDYLPRAWDEWIARVKRAAAREALDGYADAEEDSFLALHVKGAPISAAQCTHAAMTAREYRDRNFSETEDQT